MSKFQEYKSLNLPQIDKDILALWKKNDIFKKSIEERPKDNRYVFYEGPPSANGKPGIHHVMARTIKDIFCRFHTMQGQRVERKGGWDTHGLPIELSVEKELGITKEDIGKTISIEEYNRKCRETVLRYKDQWDELTQIMGYWVDLEHPYITFTNNYIESVWWLLKQIYDKDMLYKGYTIQPYSPGAGTGLSTHELNMPGAYREVKDTSAVAQFKVVRNETSEFLFDDSDDAADVYFIAWTTTPWTLPSNVALAVGKNITYVKVKTFNPYTKERINIILAEDLVYKWFRPEQLNREFDNYNPEDKLIPYRITKSFKGEELEMVEYEQLLPYVKPEGGDSFKVLLGGFVSTSDGTGIVHIAPSFGADDMQVGKKYGMASLTLVDKQGKFVDEVTDFAGRFVKDYKNEGDGYRSVDIDISIKLKEENKAFNVQKYSHNYPHCWRTDKPILYYPLDSWFIKASSVKERMVELNNTINWKPASTGEGRFGNWLENLQDWNLSRSRYWGIPLPIWRTADGSEEVCIGSYAQLEAEIQKANKALGLDQTLPDDPHRPYIDDVVLVSDSGLEMKRELDLIDVWFDSGSMPFAQWHYPFENKDLIDKGEFYPADFISEGVDQTRGWFYSLHAISAIVKNSVAYKNVVSTGLVLDKNGVKMSKRLGNAINPFEAIDKHGADAIRWYMISNASPWDNLKFDMEGVLEVKRKFFGTIYNTYSFLSLYANIDGFEMSDTIIPVNERQELDKWIISLLHSLKTKVHTAYAEYEPTVACRAIMTFVDDNLSNWYVRLGRRRFWKGEYNRDKEIAYQTLFECLEVLSQLIAPVAPFFGEWLFQNLNNARTNKTSESVHLSYLTPGDPSLIDKDLEERMSFAQRISSLGLALRKEKRIKVRQPLQKILIPVLDEHFKSQVQEVEDLILRELNIKEIEYVEDVDGIIQKVTKPNFKTLGRRLGKDMKNGSKMIQNMNQDQIASFEKSNEVSITIGDNSYILTKEDIEIIPKDIPGYQVAADKDITVALDITLTEDLRNEGLAREFVNRIQKIRKNSDFNVTDRINISYTENDKITSALSSFDGYVKNEVLADNINSVNNLLNSEEIQLADDVTIGVTIKKA